MPTGFGTSPDKDNSSSMSKHRHSFKTQVLMVYITLYIEDVKQIIIPRITVDLTLQLIVLVVTVLCCSILGIKNRALLFTSFQAVEKYND